MKRFFNNFYWRNILAYLIAMGFSSLILTQQGLNLKTRQIILALLFYSYIFIWVVFHNRVLAEKLFFKQKYILYILSTIAGLLLWFSLSYIIGKANGIPVQFQVEFFDYILFTLLGTAMFISTKYFMAKNIFLQSSLIRREAELQQLKSQLNPHFLFNALNNIYSYTLEHNKYGNSLILKLSELMRFIIEYGKMESISIKEEINFIENYLIFEKERLGERCTINYSQKLQYPERAVPPLIFFPFIENAFKHGTAAIHPSEIMILLTDNSSSVSLSVRNHILTRRALSSKTGISNAKRRLELLFPDNHTLSIISESNQFHVHLILYYHDKD